MLQRLHATAALVLGLTLAAAAGADEAEIMARYSAYNAAFDAGRFEEAAVEGEAAWRAAEAEWGAREETAVLAFNLATLQLLLERRAEAVEPALRALALVDEGVGAGSIVREEAAALVAYAKLDAEEPSREEADALDAALSAYAPTTLTGRQIARQAWFGLVSARVTRRQWREATAAAERATLLMQQDPQTEPALIGLTATFGAKSAAEIRDYEDALEIVHRGIAAFTPQPVEQPIDPVLGALLGWDAALHNIIDQRGGSAGLEEGHAGHRWAEGRHPTAMGCTIEWLEHPPPDYPSAALSRGQAIGMLFEYYLDADGSVIRVDFIGAADESAGFADAVVAALREWKATAQPRAECRGPWPMSFGFQLMR
jgi:tetratricopeptide (TPR) repeat protein